MSWRRFLEVPSRILRPFRDRRVAIGTAAGLVVGAGVTALVAAMLWPAGWQPSLGAVLVDPPPVRPGPFIVQTREFRCGLAEIVGTHAEFYPKRGQYCRVRVDVTADEAAEDYWDSLQQQLKMSDGTAVGADLDAMHIKRQPLQILLGGHETLEFDLWFDAPKDAQPTSLLVRFTAADPQITIALPAHTFPYGAAG
jgi:hypothetical protein